MSALVIFALCLFIPMLMIVFVFWFFMMDGWRDCLDFWDEIKERRRR